eukprot:scpid99315/ scgid12454/ 
MCNPFSSKILKEVVKIGNRQRGSRRKIRISKSKQVGKEHIHEAECQDDEPWGVTLRRRQGSKQKTGLRLVGSNIGGDMAKGSGIGKSTIDHQTLPLSGA